MDFMIKRGYVVIDSGEPGPIYVAPHAAPAFYKPGDHQDHNTHYVSYKLATYGGKALVSGLSRERDIGIDFYRPYPNTETALNSYRILHEGKYQDRKKDAMKTAWAAKNVTEHAIKTEIYLKFWNIVKRHDGPLVFVHRQFFNPIRHPSIMDVIPYNKKTEFLNAVTEINEKYAEVLEKMFPVYRAGYEFKTLCVDFKEDMLKNHKLKLYHGRRPNVERRRYKFKKVMEEVPELKVTYMENFKGKPMKHLIKQHEIENRNLIFQAEISEFLTRRFPDISVYMIRDILKKVCK